MSTILVRDLKINEEYVNLIPRPSLEEYGALKEDIRLNGVKYPLLVNKDKEIVDGYTRYQIAKELEIPNLPIIIRSFVDKNQEKYEVITLNLHRRHLNTSQRVWLGLQLVEIEKERAKERQGTRTDLTSGKKLPEVEGRALDIIGEKVGVSRETIRRGEIIVNKAKDDPEIKEAWEKSLQEIDNTKFNHVYNIIVRKEGEELRKQQYKEGDFAECHIVHGDSIGLLDKLEDNSFDLLLTDPPYSTEIENFELFLRKWIPRALQKVKDTGRAYVFSGSYVEEISAYIKVFKSLKNGFTLSNLLVWHYKNHLGPSPKMAYKRGWQGIFYLYGKNAPPLYNVLIKDLLDHFDYSLPQGSNIYKYHSWQKPEELIKDLIVLSTKEGGRILDLFAGSGAIGLTASKLGRYCLSVEKERELVDTCKARGLVEHAV